MRYSGFQFPEGVAVLDRETGELVYHPIDGGESRVIRPADPAAARRDPSAAASEYEEADASLDESPYPPVADDRHPRSTGEVDAPSRQADTDPGLTRSVLSGRRPLVDPLPAEGDDDDDDEEADTAGALPALADEEVAHDELDRIVLGRFPYPVASTYRSFINETDPRRACRRLVAAARGLVQFLAMVAASDVLRSPETLDEVFVRVLRRELQRPRFSTWHELLKQSLRIVRQAGQTPFCPELIAAYDRLERACDEPVVLERAPEAPLRLGIMRALVHYRDSLSEGFSFSHERAHADLATYRPVLTRLLEECRFLSDYSLVASEEASESGRRLRGAVPEEPAVGLGTALRPGAVALRHDASGRLLDLADLVILADDVSPPRQIPGLTGDVALLERRRGERLMLRSVSGRAVSRDLRAARWATLAEARSAGSPQPVSLVDRGVLGATARRVTDERLGALRSSGQLLDDITIGRDALEQALGRFEFSGFAALALVGEPGSGRTTTLARYARARLEAGDLVLFYRGASLRDEDLTGRLCADLELARTELPALLAGLAPHFQIPTNDALLDTIGPRFLVVLDGLEEASVNLAALGEAIATLIAAATEHPWFRVITSLSRAALTRLPEAVRPGEGGGSSYFRIACRRGSVRAECPWVAVAPTATARVATFYEAHRLRRGPDDAAVASAGAVFRPSTRFGELDGRGATVGALRHLGNLRLALRAYNDRPLPPDLTAEAIEAAWLRRVVDGEESGDRVSDRAQTLASVVRGLARAQAVYLPRHELEDGDRLGPFIHNAEVDSSYSQLVYLGVIEEIWVDDTCLVGLASPSILCRLLAEQIRAEASPPTDLELAARSIAYPPMAGALERRLIEALAPPGAIDGGALTLALGEGADGAALRQSWVGALTRLALDRRSIFEQALRTLSSIGSGPVTHLLSETATTLSEYGLATAARAASEATVRSARTAGDGEPLALARADLAALRAAGGEVEHALEALEAARQEAESGGHRLGAGVLALQEARLLAERGDTARARSAATTATGHLLDTDHPQARAAARLLEGRLAAEAGDTELAVTCLREGLDLTEASGGVLLATEALHAIKVTAQDAEQRAALAELVEGSLRLLQVAGRFEWIPAALAQLGTAVAGRDPRAGETYLRRGLALADRLDRHDDAAELLARLGEVLRREGRVREAERSLTRSLQLSEGDPIAAGRRRTLLMGIQIDRGELAGLEASLRRAIREAQHDDEPEVERAATLLMASVHLSKGRLAQAGDYFKRSLDRFEAAGDQASLGEALAGLAEVAARRGDDGAAREQWEAVLALGEALSLSTLTARAHEGLAWLDPVRAEGPPNDHLRALAQMAERFEHRLWQQRAAAVRGRLAFRRGALDEAAAAWRDALERAEHLGLGPAAARARLGLGRVHLEAGQLGPAHQEAQTAGSFFEAKEHDLDLADALAVQGVCSFTAGRLEAAEECFDRQRSLAAALGDDPGLARGLRLGAEVAFELGLLEDATTRWQRFTEMTDGQEAYRIGRDVLALRAVLADGRPEEIARAQGRLERTTEGEAGHRPLGDDAALVFKACASFWAEQGDEERAQAARAACRIAN